ncbi:MAG: helix-turn-helix transcriptional regulator [Candidatus Omnitrophota bacterium]
MKIAKYFWDLNPKALIETKKALGNPRHPKFVTRMVHLLSRCDKPHELFSLISKKDFIAAWPKLKSHWLKIERVSDFRDWWQSIYEQLLEESGFRQRKPAGAPAGLLLKIGGMIKQARLRRHLSQKELSIIAGVSQSDISSIEKGKKNITLQTLTRFCKVLGIKKIIL